MKWEQRSDWHWARLCGRYTVSRSLSYAKPAHPHGCWLWDAWFKPHAGAVAQQLNTDPLDDKEAAIAVCTAHVKQNSSRPAAA